MRRTLGSVAPGTAMREGLERILRGRTGALVVLGFDKQVDSLCTGGFTLDVEFSATRLRELAKMDGAIVVDTKNNRIVRAATQLVPDPAIPTSESGTRHRTAERTARQTGHPVISVSQSMHLVALYLDDARHVLEDSSEILSRANQALATLERYRHRLDEVAGTLSALEIEDLATLRDVATVAQRQEMVRRIHTEIEGYVVELGSDGRLLSLQLTELVAGLAPDRALLVQDYVHDPATDHRTHLSDLEVLTQSDVLELPLVANALGYTGGEAMLDQPISPRGYRLLARVPRLPGSVVERLVTHFGGLQQLLSANVEDLLAIDGVGGARARTIREALSRLAEASIMDRYV
ncbi:MAG: DNA integrity scanning diadenylate cyclase DisA [Jiangellales bacterium]